MEQMPSREAVSRQIGRILASPDFDASPKQVALLEFVVDQALAGRTGRIDDATLAAEVFGRGADYDRRVDPIVAIQVDRLRRSLARYYRAAGQRDPLRIVIPKGTLVPTFISASYDN